MKELLHIITTILLTASCSALGGTECLKDRLATLKVENGSELILALEKVGEKHQLSQSFYSLLTAIMEKESTFNHDSASNKGAVGVMQLTKPAVIDAIKYCKLPSTTTRMKLEDNIELGVCYLKWLQHHYNLSMIEVPIAYNGGFQQVIRYRAKQAIPKETYLYSLGVVDILAICEIPSYQ